MALYYRGHFMGKRSYNGNEFVDWQDHARIRRTNQADVHNYESYFGTGMIEKIPLAIFEVRVIFV
jgi:hypothetical protein